MCCVALGTPFTVIAKIQWVLAICCVSSQQMVTWVNIGHISISRKYNKPYEMTQKVSVVKERNIYSIYSCLSQGMLFSSLFSNVWLVCCKWGRGESHQRAKLECSMDDSEPSYRVLHGWLVLLTQVMWQQEFFKVSPSCCSCYCYSSIFPGCSSAWLTTLCLPHLFPSCEALQFNFSFQMLLI